MRVLRCLAACLALVTCWLAGCDKGNTPPAQAREGQMVPVAREFRGQQGPFPDRGLFVIQRPEIWEALWDGQQVPDVDFSRYMVVAALMGQQPTAGYDINITDVRATGQRVVVYVTQTAPRPGTLVAQALAYPYHMVVIPKATQPVEFVVANCDVMLAPIVDAFQGTQSVVATPLTAIVRDQITWNKLWIDTFGGDVAAPPVDFTRNMAIAVYAGQKPTGGYGVTIATVERLNDRLVVDYRLRSPLPGQVVTQALTAPYAIAIVPTSPLPVIFRNVTPVPIIVPVPQ